MPSSYISCILEGFPSEQSNQSSQRKPLLLHIAVTELIQAIASPGCALPDSKQAFAALSFPRLCTWCKHCWSTTIRISIIFESFAVSTCVHSEDLQASFTPSVYFLLFFVYFETITAGNFSLHICSMFCALMRLSEKEQNFLWEARRLSKSLKLVMRRCMLHFSQRNWSLRFKNLNQIIFLPTLHC